MDADARARIEFGFFVVHRLAERTGRTVPEEYRRLAGCGALSGYVVPFYDVLHTLGEDALLDEVEEYARRRGARP